MRQKVGNTIRWIAIVLLAATVLTAAFLAGREWWSQTDDSRTLSRLLPTPSVEDEGEAGEGFAALCRRNPDLYAWMEIPDTGVSYPIMYTPAAPQKYLRADFEGAYSRSGVPFMDERCTPDSPNRIIYGHNMMTGTMFSDVAKYEKKEFADSHPQIRLLDSTGWSTFAVSAVVYTDDRDEWLERSEPDAATLEDVQKRARYTVGAPLTENDRLITLVTCVGPKQQYRLLVIARRIRE